MHRRNFLKTGLLGITGGAKVLMDIIQESVMENKKSRIALVKTNNRREGIRRAVKLLGISDIKDTDVLIKPNFNSADPFPASTHNETLEELINLCKENGAKRISIGERSGFAGLITTESVFKEKGIYEIVKKYGIKLINFDELRDKEWLKFRDSDLHWLNGFKIAKPLVETETVISTCCLKTHRFGGVFTMSLKLSVGGVKKSYMSELHTSFRSMRKMIAEINLAYKPRMIVLDGIAAFVDGGPEKGVLKNADVILAGTDRVAIDAVGVAILKELGSNKEIMEKRIFEHEQIKRAAELGLGVSSPNEIEIITDDNESRNYANKINDILVTR